MKKTHNDSLAAKNKEKGNSSALFLEKAKKIFHILLHSKLQYAICSIWLWKSNIKAELQIQMM
jgi:hypothetical protein